MSFLWAILSMVGYSLDSVFMARIYRTLTPLQGVASRGLALTITASPLLLLSPSNDYALLGHYLPQLLAAAACSVFANWGYANSVRYFPVGIVNSIVMGSQTLLMLLLGWMVWDERISIIQMTLILGIIMVNFLITYQPYQSTHQLQKNKSKGLIFAAINGIFQSISFFLLALVARKSNPYLAAYFWEALIGVFAISILAFRHPHTLRDQCFLNSHFWKVILYSSPTILGTLSFSFATTFLPLGIVAAVVGMLVVTTSVLSMYVHGERLSVMQWVLIALSTLLLIALKGRVA